MDVLVPTHNRAALLERCVRSLIDADPSPYLDVHITVVCNACTDGSADIVRDLQAQFPGRISLVVERRQGKSKALNAGIASTSGDLVGMVDDDEQVDRRWLQVAGEAFRDPAVEFIGGPYIPVWGAPPPEWIPAEYMAALGAVDNGPHRRRFDRDFPGQLMGGNAIIRRSTLEQVGPYAEHLGPGAHARLFSCEDEDMYLRLIERGARGEYLPGLVIYHYIPAVRLSREYYRRWCFWRGVSLGLMDRRHPLRVTYLAGVPRFLWGRAARAALRLMAARGRPAREAFGDELQIWDVAGYFYGRQVYPLARFSPVKSRRRNKGSAARASNTRAGGAGTEELAGCSTGSRQ
ncbi:MAG TPA: glycosyltransferase family 2 protein [Vicinamibacterales bacterium]|nr:glycosyltransferase family 2 protein [Vicinamibacterales bacterium]